MKLLINHQTTYRYDRLVRHSVQYLRLTPKHLSNQRVLNWNLAASGPIHTQPDGFGNLWTTLTLQQPHQELLIMAQGTVEIDPRATSITDQSLPIELFLAETELTKADEAIRTFAAKFLKQPDRHSLIALSEAIIEQMPYTPGSTDVMTKAADAFALGRGVCQDHTHVFLACVRSQQIPARYVSGYLYISDRTHLASHAWAEVWLAGHWYCFDVSNQMFTPKQHVQLAVGRDYLDAAPVRGMRQGGGKELMDTLVQVLPSLS